VNDTIAVAIVTGLSALLGAAIAALSTLKSQQQQISLQADLATQQRKDASTEKVAKERKEAYLEFLTIFMKWNELCRIAGKNLLLPNMILRRQ
jgi:hypothetical protein